MHCWLLHMRQCLPLVKDNLSLQKAIFGGYLNSGFLICPRYQNSEILNAGSFFCFFLIKNKKKKKKKALSHFHEKLEYLDIKKINTNEHDK